MMHIPLKCRIQEIRKLLKISFFYCSFLIMELGSAYFGYVLLFHLITQTIEMSSYTSLGIRIICFILQFLFFILILIIMWLFYMLFNSIRKEISNG